MRYLLGGLAASVVLLFAGSVLFSSTTTKTVTVDKTRYETVYIRNLAPRYYSDKAILNASGLDHLIGPEGIGSSTGLLSALSEQPCQGLGVDCGGLGDDGRRDVLLRLEPGPVNDLLGPFEVGHEAASPVRVYVLAEWDHLIPCSFRSADR